MDEKTKKLHQAINDYIVEANADCSAVYSNLAVFYELSSITEDILFKYVKYIKQEIDFSKVTKMPLFEKLNLIDKFYKDHGIEFDLNKYINDGTIDFLYYDFFNDNHDSEKQKIYNFDRGGSYYDDSKKLVDICNNGFVTDILVAIHELSHFRNQPDNRRNEINSLLTEALAYAEEFICADYLSTLGYEEDMIIWKKMMLCKFALCAANTRPKYAMFMLFKELGNIDEGSYKLLYNNKREHNDIVKYMSRFSENKDFNLYFDSRYVMGSLFGMHMYNEYKKDPSFIKNIILLNKKLNDNNMIECFQLMGLSDLGDEDKEKLRNSLENVVCEVIEKGKSKTLKK